MLTSGTLSVRDPLVEQPPADFLTGMGLAAMVWAEVEAGLCDIFRRSRALEAPAARQVFYMHRTFGGRIDMLRSAAEFPAARLHATDAAIARHIGLTCGDWVGWRDLMAHGRIRRLGAEAASPGAWAVMDIECDLSRGARGEAIDAAQVAYVYANFSSLLALVNVFLEAGEGVQGPSGEACLSMLRRLPRDPRGGEMSASDRACLAQLVGPRLRLCAAGGGAG
jgi:hypothetical protein